MATDIPISYQKIGAVRDALDGTNSTAIIEEAIDWAYGEPILAEHLPDHLDSVGVAALTMVLMRAVYQFDKAVLHTAVEQAHA